MPLIYLIFWLIKKFGPTCMYSYAYKLLASFSIPNFYASLYASQLVFGIIIALNLKHIREIGIRKSMQEDWWFQIISNIVTLVILAMIALSNCWELVLYILRERSKRSLSEVQADVAKLEPDPSKRIKIKTERKQH